MQKLWGGIQIEFPGEILIWKFEEQDLTLSPNVEVGGGVVQKRSNVTLNVTLQNFLKLTHRLHIKFDSPSFLFWNWKLMDLTNLTWIDFLDLLQNNSSIVTNTN